MKRCVDCGREFPISEFPKRGPRGGKKYPMSMCRECWRARRATGGYVPRSEPVPDYPTGEKECVDCGQSRPAIDFKLDRRFPDGLSQRCKSCVRAWREQSMEGMTPEDMEAFQDRRAKSTDRAALSRRVATLRNYHLPLADYEQRLKEQDYRCALCGEMETAARGEQVWDLAVDHDHECCPEKSTSCGKCVRGLVCSRCNIGLGMFGDDVEVMLSAVEYLEFWNSQRGG